MLCVVDCVRRTFIRRFQFPPALASSPPSASDNTILPTFLRHLDRPLPSGSPSRHLPSFVVSDHIVSKKVNTRKIPLTKVSGPFTSNRHLLRCNITQSNDTPSESSLQDWRQYMPPDRHVSFGPEVIHRAEHGRTFGWKRWRRRVSGRMWECVSAFLPPSATSNSGVTRSVPDVVKTMSKELGCTQVENMPGNSYYHSEVRSHSAHKTQTSSHRFCFTRAQIF